MLDIMAFFSLLSKSIPVLGRVENLVDTELALSEYTMYYKNDKSGLGWTRIN